MYIYWKVGLLKKLYVPKLLRTYRDSKFVQLVAILHLILLEEGKAGKYL